MTALWSTLGKFYMWMDITLTAGKKAVSLGLIDEDKLAGVELGGFTLDTDDLVDADISFKQVQEYPGEFPQIDLDDVHFTQ